LVESVERLLEKSTRDAFTDFLRIASGDKSIRVALSCRDYSTELVRSSLLDGVGVTHIRLNVPDLSDEELDQASAKFPGLSIPLAKAPLCSVLRNPYFLGRALQISWKSETAIPGSEREFRSLFWREIVRADHQAYDGMPIRRERAFTQIALNRARSLTLFVSRLGLDDGAVDALRRDSLISVSESSVSQITPSHDVLEDWAILQWIGDIYERHSTNISGFCEELGAYPAVRRSYRKWISELIDADPSKSEHLFLECLTPQIPAWFRDGTILSFLWAGGAADFLRSHQDYLFRDERQLLHRVIHLLRVGCVKTPDWLAGQGLLLTVPDGYAWSALLGLIHVHLAEFTTGEAQALLRLLEDWTKDPSRLARDLGRKQWGDEGYAQEELVAELGAAFLCADLELATEPREENASYIADWLEVLKNDTRFIFKAAAHAQHAADYLRAISGGTPPRPRCTRSVLTLLSEP
jgi:hypothetical protein